MSSTFSIFKPPRSKPLKIYPFPAPGAPANIIALGLPCISFSISYNFTVEYLL